MKHSPFFSCRGKVGSFCVLLGVLLLVAFVYCQVLSFQFLPAWDDDTNITHNLLYAPLNWESLFAFWKQPYNQLYLPITYTLWAALVAFSRVMAGTSISMGPISPVLFHGANLFLHLGAVALVFFILQKALCFFGRRLPTSSTVLFAAASGALFFGLHPMQVETVAWASCFRDLLGAVFSFSSIFVFLCWLEERGSHIKQLFLFISATLLLLLALGSKPGCVIVPAMALLLGVWILSFQNFKKKQAADQNQIFEHSEKSNCELPTTNYELIRLCWLIPWFAMALMMVLITSYVQTSAALARDLVPIWARPLVAMDALAFYLSKIFVPFHICADYGRSPNAVLEDGQLYWTWMLPVGVAVVLWCWRRLRIFLLPYGLLLIAVAPTLGLIPFNFQIVSTVSDRYLYLGMLGPALALALFLVRSASKAVFIGVSMMMIIYSAISLYQLPSWTSGERLFPAILKINPESWKSRHNYACALMQQGKCEEAIVQFKEGLALRPTDADAQNDLGVAYLRTGHGNEAKEIFLLQADFNTLVAYNLATAWLLLKQPQETVAVFRRTLQLFPEDNVTKGHLAWMLATYPDDSLRNGTEAVALAKEIVLKTHGEDPHFLVILAAALAETHQFSDAVATAEKAAMVTERSGNHQKALWIRNEVAPLFQQQKPFRCHTGFLEAF